MTDTDALTALTALDDEVLRANYDSGSLARGRTYAGEDRVTLLDAGPGVIKALCQGSGRSSYVSWIRWHRRGIAVELVDSCTCPIGGGCKHCVAAVVTARRPALAEVVTTGPSWRRALAALETDGEPDPHHVGLALQFVVQHPRQGRYGGDTGPWVTVRPLRKGRSGTWIKTGASWRDLGSPYHHRRAEVDPAHLAAVQALMTSGRINGYYGTTQAVPLGQFDLTLWYQLERAVEAGITLVDDRGAETLTLSPTPAVADCDLRQDPTGAVELTTGFAVDGRRLDLDEGRWGLVGTPPHGAWAVEGSHLHLVPLTAPLHPTVARLVGNPPLVIPPDDVDEFLDAYQPALAGQAAVGSADGSVTITARRFDRLVLTVERTAIDVTELRWSAEYRRGERSSRHRLADRGGRNRDRAAEAAAIEALTLPLDLLETLVDDAGLPRDLTVSGPQVATVLPLVVAAIEADGQVQVEHRGDEPTLREASIDPLISFAVTDADPSRDGTDWFDLGVEVSIDGQAIDFADLFAALHRGDEALILASGTWFRLDRPELVALRDLIDEAVGLVDAPAVGVARVNPYQTAWWDELRRLGVVAHQSRRWTERVARMGALTTPEPLDPPPGLTAVLRPYQQEGYEWLAFLHRHGLGGILADDMGLGKTVQTLALALTIHEADPQAKVLVVAPTSVVENWAHEAERFAPGLAVRTIRETAARRGTPLDDEVAAATVIVTSYALFRLEFDAYARHGWELLLLDEAQFVKNHQAKTHQCVRRLDAGTKVAITGTPLENSLMDLWSLLSITAPGLFPDPKRFSDTYRVPIENGTAPERLATLQRRIAPLMRRRTKDDVLTELPPKTEQVIDVELTARHARIYATQLQRQRQKVLGLVGDVSRHRFEILKSLTLLRQLALDPGLVDEAHDSIGSAKLDRLLEDLTQVVAEGHRALVFSQFTRYLARVRARLDAAGIPHAYLDGRTRRRDRAIGRFKDGEVPVFVISLKAGGFGLNLTEADYCFVLDPWWNPATEAQAVDRAHRIGQENPVMVYRYVSVGTIEEKVMDLKARKAELFANVMDADGGLAGPLSEADIRGLLELG